MEGYQVTGMSNTAQYCGSFDVDTVRAAVRAYIETRVGDDKALFNFEHDPPTFWLCQFFDNEADARKGYG